MLVSILMPTRNPRDWLEKALSSIRATAKDNSQVEILLRVDDDDAERIGWIPELKEAYDVKVVIGPRGIGYQNMGGFVNDLVAIAQGKWCWLFDDDSWVEGDWQTPLNAIPCDPVNGPAVNAEIYKLGFTSYQNSPTGCCVGLLMPSATVKALNNWNPVDLQWLQLAMDRGWTVRQLPGVLYGHEGRPR